MPVCIADAVIADIASAKQWYEEKRKGLGTQFAMRIDEAVGFISNNPEGRPEIHRGVRKFVARQFPYLVFYRIEAEQVVIIGCRHERENPAKWPEV